MALRSHCSPKMASRAPTTSRSAVSGSSVIVGPSAATITASTARAAAMPWNVDLHSRVRPAASTMVSASIASTAQATKTVRMRGSAVTGLLPGLVLEYGGDGKDCERGRGLPPAGQEGVHGQPLHLRRTRGERGRPGQAAQLVRQGTGARRVRRGRQAGGREGARRVRAVAGGLRRAGVRRGGGGSVTAGP